MDKQQEALMKKVKDKIVVSSKGAAKQIQDFYNKQDAKLNKNEENVSG